ncbi:MAG: hypothetical protein PHQ23_04705 [Candidatus Wallbacteria bacterium]|nr:hypothetical protein [Candidatus Wallbacteria bacterium]
MHESNTKCCCCSSSTSILLSARHLAHMTDDETMFLLKSQQVLERKRLVSETLLNGLVGKRFDRPLAFYLSNTDRYLRSLAKLSRDRIVSQA